MKRKFYISKLIDGELEKGRSPWRNRYTVTARCPEEIAKGRAKWIGMFEDWGYGLIWIRDDRRTYGFVAKDGWHPVKSVNNFSLRGPLK